MRSILFLVQLLVWVVVAVLLAQTVEWNKDGVVSFFISQTRVDMALNHFLLLLLLLFILAYGVLRLWGVLFNLPARAVAWRKQQRQHLALSRLIEGLELSFAGRTVRAYKAWQSLLAHEHAAPVAHILCATARHTVQDFAGRDGHIQAAQAELNAGAGHKRMRAEVTEAIILLQAEWAERAGQPKSAMQSLQQLSAGGARRTPALRQKLRLYQQLHQYEDALETARLLARHRAFSVDAAKSLLSSLVQQVLNQARDAEKLQQFWQKLNSNEQAQPKLRLCLAQNMMRLAQSTHALYRADVPAFAKTAEESGDDEPESADLQRQAFSTLWALWAQYESMPTALKMQFCRLLIACRHPWQTVTLMQLEPLANSYSRDAAVQCLAACVTLALQLPGKAQQYLERAQYLLRTQAETSAAAQRAQAWLQQTLWQVQALLAEQTGDMQAALNAWKQATLSRQPLDLSASN